MMKFAITFLLIAFTMSGCAAVDRWSGVSQAKELQKNGEVAQATILKIWDTGMTVNDDPVVGFLLEVQPENKESYQAETKLRISRLHIPMIQPGATIQVRYDPVQPTRVSLDMYDYSK
jgi:hypothetical protein